MKKLYILRHAKSDYPAKVGDHDRPLNARGEAACRIMGRYIREQKIKPEVILCSDALRTRQTITYILREARYDTPVQYSAKLYQATPGEILKELAKIDDNAQSAMVVCHNPGVAGLAAALTGSGDLAALARLKTKYSTAGLACLSLDTGSWAEIYPGSGELEAFVVPKELESGIKNQESRTKN